MLCYRYESVLRVDVGVGGVSLDELTAGLHIVAHEHGEDLVGFGCILDAHLLQQAVGGIHGGLPELFGVHLTKTFVALCVQSRRVLVASHILINKGLALLLGVAVLRNLLIGALIERRCSDVEVASYKVSQSNVNF